MGHPILRLNLNVGHPPQQMARESMGDSPAGLGLETSIVARQ
jgi:hypothetical protein